MLWNTSVFNDLDEMRKDMDALSEMLGYTGSYRSSFPRLNAYQDADAYYVAADVPGVLKNHIEATVDAQTLTLRGDRPAVGEGHHRKLLRQERESGSFEKIFRFPGKVDGAAVTAKLENGVLLVRVPKAQDAKAKSIEIKA